MWMSQMLWGPNVPWPKCSVAQMLCVPNDPRPKCEWANCSEALIFCCPTIPWPKWSEAQIWLAQMFRGRNGCCPKGCLAKMGVTQMCLWPNVVWSKCLRPKISSPKKCGPNVIKDQMCYSLFGHFYEHYEILVDVVSKVLSVSTSMLRIRALFHA